MSIASLHARKIHFIRAVAENFARRATFTDEA